MFLKKSLLLLFFFSTFSYGIDGARYRFDYTYSRNADGWLKMHQVPATWNVAMRICHAEGAVLASPLTHDMRDEMVKMATDYKASTIFTGVHSQFAKGVYSSIEGVPLNMLPISWAEGEPDNLENSESCLAMQASDNGTMKDVNCSTTLPFICYLKKSKAMLVTGCGTHDTVLPDGGNSTYSALESLLDKLKDYYLEPRTSKCYKFHRTSMRWSDAYMTCMAEGGYLAFISNDVDITVFRELFAKNPNSLIIGGKYPDFAHLGISAKNGLWMSIHGDDVKKERWISGQPDNGTQPEGEFCGVTYRGNGLYCDSPCSWAFPFICEKKPESLVQDPDDLFNV